MEYQPRAEDGHIVGFLTRDRYRTRRRLEGLLDVYDLQRSRLVQRISLRTRKQEIRVELAFDRYPNRELWRRAGVVKIIEAEEGSSATCPQAPARAPLLEAVLDAVPRRLPFRQVPAATGTWARGRSTTSTPCHWPARSAGAVCSLRTAHG